jgi:hypothetical protein
MVTSASIDPAGASAECECEAHAYNKIAHPPPPPTTQQDSRAVALFKAMQAQREADPTLRPDPDTCLVVLRPLARARRLDEGLALLEEVLGSPQGPYVSRYPLPLFLLAAVRAKQGPGVAARLAGILEVRVLGRGGFGGRRRNVRCPSPVLVF